MSLNKVILIGNVGKDPDVRYFDSGAAVANFPLATSERGYTLANGTMVVCFRFVWRGRFSLFGGFWFLSWKNGYVKVPVYMWKARFVLVIMMTKAA